MNKRIISFLASAFLVFGFCLSGCNTPSYSNSLETSSSSQETSSEGSPSSQESSYRLPTSVDLNTNYVTLAIGETYQLEPTISPDNAYDKTLTYESENISVANVSDGGLITAQGEGVTNIKATTINGLTDEVRVNVVVPTLVLHNPAEQVFVGDVLTLELDSSYLDEDSFLWSSSDPSIAKIDNSGTLEALEEGTVTITVTSGAYSDSITISIHDRETYYTEGLYFMLNSDNSSYRVVAYGGNSEIVYIPSSYNDLPVTTIDNYCFDGNVNIKKAFIPNSLVSIGEGAFQNCSSLVSINIPDSVTTIGIGAFYLCSSLETVNIGENSRLNLINYRLFYGCSALTRIYISNSVTAIGEGAFQNCSSLVSINIPDSITTIGFDENVALSGAFQNCSSLEIVNIGKNSQLTTINHDSFRNCSSLVSINIPDSVTFIGMSAFYGCSSLESIYIPDSVTLIFYDAFRDCISLTIYCEVLSEPSGWLHDVYGGSWNSSKRPVVWSYLGIKGVTESGFRYAVSLDANGDRYVTIINYEGAFAVETTIPSTIDNIPVKAIATSAFWYSSSRIFYIPDSVTTIGEVAFAESRVESLNIGENSRLTTIGDSAFGNCYFLTSILIPDSVTTIGMGAFSSCYSLTSIYIPNSVASIESWAFGNCANLTIYCEAPSEPEGWALDWNNSNRLVNWGITYEEYLEAIGQ